MICALSGDSAEDLELIREMAEAGHIRTLVDKQFPLEQAAEAHRYEEEGKKKGNVVILMGE